MRKIKIAQVITRMDWGGSPDIVRIICDKLDPLSYEVKLIYGPTNYPGSKTLKFLSDFKDKTEIIPQLRRNINPAFDLLALLKLYSIFRREKFDIVQTHTAKAGVLGRIAAKLAGVPKVIHMSHGHNFYGYFGTLGSALVPAIERFCTKFADKVVALTELEKRDLISFKVCGPEKITVINSGVELDYYRNVRDNIPNSKNTLRIDSGLKLVGMVSRLEPVKGAQYIVETAKLVTKMLINVKFLIVGEGSLRAAMEAEARKLKLHDKFLFMGWREDIPAILSVLDVLVQPSLNEAVGRILIEAGACGVPAVATRVGGVAEIVKDNETGILVAPKDPQALAKGIIFLLENKEKRDAMGIKARSLINEKYSAQNMVSAFSDLYRQVYNEKN